MYMEAFSAFPSKLCIICLLGPSGDPHRDRARLALSSRWRGSVDSSVAGFPQRTPENGQDHASRRARRRFLPSCVESDREMVSLLRYAAGRATSGARYESHSLRCQARLGRPTAASPVGATTAKPRPGTRDRGQPDVAAWSLRYTGARESRLRGLEASRVIDPRD